jgi:chemotaxis-related protein WspD
MSETSALILDDCWNRIGVRGDTSCPELRRHIHCRNCPIHAAAAVAVLDRAPPSGYLADWTSHFAKAAETAAEGGEDAATQSLVIFRIGAEWLALPTSVFMEVAEFRPIHTIPYRRSGVVLGIVNIHGEILICVSLAKLLSLDDAAAPPRGGTGMTRRRLLVMGREGRRLVFPVDEVQGIHQGRTADFIDVPATIAKAAATYTTAMLSWQGRTVGCLDAELLFYTLDRSVA